MNNRELSNMSAFELEIKKIKRSTKVHEKVSFMEPDTFSPVFYSSTCGVLLYNHNHIYDLRMLKDPQLTCSETL